MRYIQAEFLTKEKLEEAVILLRQGDTDQLDAIIMHHMPGAMSVAARWVSRYPRKANEIQAAAFHGLTVGANRARTALVDNNITPYLWTYVTGEILEYLRNDHLMPVPKEQLDKGHSITMTGLVYRSPDGEVQTVDIQDNTKIFDIEDMLKYLEVDELETKILKLRMDDWTLEDIGLHFGRSRVWVRKVLDSIGERYIKKEKQYEGDGVLGHGRRSGRLHRWGLHTLRRGALGGDEAVAGSGLRRAEQGAADDRPQQQDSGSDHGDEAVLVNTPDASGGSVPVGCSCQIRCADCTCHPPVDAFTRYLYGGQA